MDIHFRPKLACAFILTLYDAQWSQLLHLKTVHMHLEKCEYRLDRAMDGGILLFFTVSVTRYLKPFGFFPISLSVFAPMLYGNSNILAVITRGISSGFSGVVDVC